MSAARAALLGTHARWRGLVGQETLLLLAIALLLAIVIKAFFVQAFYIPSPSMEPQFVRNDRILVQKVSYWTHGPRRGDIVVFKDPGGWLTPEEEDPPTSPVKKVLEHIGLYPAGGHLVKRVIGVGGDHVVCCDSQGRITVNGRALEEYFPSKTHIMVLTEPLRVTEMSSVYDVDATIHGGGPTGQAGALRLGIARALVELDPELRTTLKRAGFLTRDAREKESKKYGLKKARKAPQYSKR